MIVDGKIIDGDEIVLEARGDWEMDCLASVVEFWGAGLCEVLGKERWRGEQ